MEAPLELEFTVACPPEHAFSVWTERTSLWWPKGHSVSGDPQLEVTFEPRPGGRIFERTAAGDEHDWGEVLEWERRAGSPTAGTCARTARPATRVEISFAPADEGTAVRIVHSEWQRAGQRERNERGWAGLLPRFTAACTAGPEPAAESSPAGR